MPDNEKRKPGGQPGNQNARKHGFYTKASKETLKEMAAITEEYKKLHDEFSKIVTNPLSFLMYMDGPHTLESNQPETSVEE